MKTIILFYSRSGKTRALAKKKAAELECDIQEIFDVKKPSVFTAVIKAIRRSKGAIQPIKVQLDSYDKIIIMSPVWAGHPVPAINSVFSCLPQGKKIEIIMVSGGGGTKESEEKTKQLAAANGCEVVGYTDLKAVMKDNEVLGENISENRGS